MQRIFAHRGASAYAPENTLEAFDLEAGADMLIGDYPDRMVKVRLETRK